MKIAVLSWGSLIKSGKDRGLAIIGDFVSGGPKLPIEFSRVSQSGNVAGCLTLVIDEKNGVPCPTQYAVSAMNHLDWALANLRGVERITLKYSVGYVNLVHGTERGWARENHPRSCDIITAWAREKNFDAVIWTSLLSNFEKTQEKPFTVDNAVSYVNGLSPQLKQKAMDYVMNAPGEVITPVRSRLSGTIIIASDLHQRPADEEQRRHDTLMRFLNNNIRPNR